MIILIKIKISGTCHTKCFVIHYSYKNLLVMGGERGGGGGGGSGGLGSWHRGQGEWRGMKEGGRREEIMS